MKQLLAISKQLTKGAAKWPLSPERRLDVLRLAKRIRLDAMDEIQIELFIISAAVEGSRTVDDFADATGLSRKEIANHLERMWQLGTFNKGKQSVHGTGRPQTVFIYEGEFPSKQNNSDEMSLELPS